MIDDLPPKLKLMLENPDKFSKNLVTTVAKNIATSYIVENNLPLSMEEHLINLFLRGSNWQRYQNKKKELESDESN